MTVWQLRRSGKNVKANIHSDRAKCFYLPFRDLNHSPTIHLVRREVKTERSLVIQTQSCLRLFQSVDNMRHCTLNVICPSTLVPLEPKKGSIILKKGLINNHINLLILITFNLYPVALRRSASRSTLGLIQF